MSDTDIHSCGYYCDRHACIVAQRNELRDKLFGEQWVKTYSGGKPNYTEPCERCGKVNPAEIHTCSPKQPEQEPAAWMWDVYSGAGYTSRGIDFFPTDIPFAKHTPLYTAPQSEWVGLTNEEIEEIYTNAMSDFDFIFDTQAKLKEKNSTTDKNIQTSDKNG
jgi:hypothetical protein